MNVNLVILLLLVTCKIVAAQQRPSVSSNLIILEGEIPISHTGDSIEMKVFPVERIAYISPEKRVFRKEVASNFVKWKFTSSKPVHINTSFVQAPSLIGYHLELGDSIFIRYTEGQPVFSGTGADKFKLIYRLNEIEDSLESTPFAKRLSREYTPLNSLEDYFFWNEYLNRKLVLMLNLVDSFSHKITFFTYNVLKEKLLYEIEEKRLGRFRFLIGKAQAVNANIPVNRFNLTNEDLCAIYDSTMNGPAAKWLQQAAPLVGDPYYLWEIVQLDAYRQRRQFFKNNPSDTGILGRDNVDAYIVAYNLAKEKYKGIIREEVLAFFFHYPRGVIHTFGFDPKVELILADYYKQPGYSRYKRVVREYELEQRERQSGKRDIDFTLVGEDGLNFTKKQLLGKVAILDFWFTGCKGCVQMVPALKAVEKAFENDTNVVFLSVSVDKDRNQWLNSITQGKYTTGKGINLYTGGEGSKHRMIRNFGIDGYPSLLLFDAYGKTIRQRVKQDPRSDNGKELIALIKKQLALIKDGPYILREDGFETAYLINGKSLVSQRLGKDTTLEFPVQTDKFGDFFTVLLRKEHRIETSEYEMPAKLVALSDIEGNFEAFRKLLQTNQVIDERYNWIFGDGHLVFAGDMFDRGDQVTECLWLIYSLEEKARAAGGYVHFLLGNHEVMNLQGDHRYVQEKYRVNAKLLNRSIADLYGKESELGRWLRTKNVVEKIGDVLFTHAGISSKINQMGLTAKDINRLARPYYDVNRVEYADDRLNVIMSTSLGPFWYRGYYYNAESKVSQIDSTLSRFGVSRIVTGHTIISDTISIHHGGRIVNIDTHHAKGKSEALLIEKGNFYRVDIEGRRALLIKRRDVDGFFASF